MHPPINGTEQRLDAILEELKALRGLLEQPEEQPAPQGDVLPLREPARRGKPKKPPTTE